MRYAYLLFLVLSSAGFADDPFECVDPDVANAFLGNRYQSQPEYSTSIPDGFVLLDLPEGLSLVGSEIADSTTTVVYKTDMDAGRALGAAANALSRSGWTDNEHHLSTAGRGFQSRSTPLARSVCHDDERGALSVAANSRSGHTLVSYIWHSGSGSCDGPAAALPHHDPSKMLDQMPILRLPEAVKTSNRGSGGTGDEVSSRVDISGAADRAGLRTALEGQIRNQGWQYQTGWSSRFSSGSVWTLETEEDGMLIGTLHMFDAGVDPIRLRFSLNPVNPTKGAGHGTWSGSSN